MKKYKPLLSRYNMSSPFDINTDNSFELSPSYGDRETGVGFYIFLLSYTVFCIAFIAPLVLWTNRYTVAHTTTLPSEFNSVVDLHSTRSVGEHPPSQATSHHQNNTITSASNHSKPPLIRSVVREIDRVSKDTIHECKVRFHSYNINI